MSRLSCKTELRRNLVRQREGWNGLDYLEVSECQLILTVYFLGKAPREISKENIRIEGGRRIRDMQVTHIEIHREEDPEIDDYMEVFVDRYGDASNYQLCLIEIDPETKKPHPMVGFDSRYSCIEFNFKASCASDLDCKTSTDCAPTQIAPPDINNLAKDFASFRQLILDRLALTMPQWRERHIPDLGITLVELLAYIGDHLSYYQDAIATEAYLGTARRRVSVRRHVRLVDYRLHEGCNARTWVVFEVASDYPDLLPDDFYLITTSPYDTMLKAEQLPSTLPKPYLIFEPLVADREKKIPLYVARNSISIYSWGDAQCCLPTGSTGVTLIDPGIVTSPAPETKNNCNTGEHDGVPRQTSPQNSDYRLNLNPCDVLIFEEVKGPNTGHKGDADPRHRQAVRLTKATKSKDPLNGQLIWEIEWAEQDALTFALCVSSINREDCSLIADVSVVRGNVLLVDHGESHSKNLDAVPEREIAFDCDDPCTPRARLKIPARFKPPLGKTDMSFSQALAGCKYKSTDHNQCTPASELLTQDPRAALPVIELHTGTSRWQPKLDLLESYADDLHFVAEMEEDRSTTLRFGDGRCGRQPPAGAVFGADYRTGNGSVGNVGAESITHIVFRDKFPNGVQFINIRNPFPACGGTDAEPIAEAKLFAPSTFRKTLQRAITPQDYADIVLRDFSHKVQRAAAQLRWAGSWYEMIVAIDRLGSESADDELIAEIKQHLNRYRRIGHDLIVKPARYISLEITLCVCVLPHFQRGHIKAELLKIFSDRLLPNNKKGLFHPDNLSFGDGIYLSRLVAAAQAIAGIESVQVTQLERQFEGPNDEVKNGILPLGPFEIARLSNDLNYPENGNLILDIRGRR
jgi:hypothetical protein